MSPSAALSASCGDVADAVAIASRVRRLKLAPAASTCSVAPSSVTATFTSDYGAAQSVTIAPQSGKPSSRIIIPQSNKRSSRLKVRLRNAVQSEAFGLEGQVMLIEVDSSTRTTRK